MSLWSSGELAYEHYLLKLLLSGCLQKEPVNTHHVYVSFELVVKEIFQSYSFA